MLITFWQLGSLCLFINLRLLGNKSNESDVYYWRHCLAAILIQTYFFVNAWISFFFIQIIFPGRVMV